MNTEGAFQFWASELRYPVEGKTNIVLTDNTDFDGGVADSAAKIIVINTSAARSFNEWLNSRDESKNVAQRSAAFTGSDSILVQLRLETMALSVHDQS